MQINLLKTNPKMTGITFHFHKEVFYLARHGYYQQANSKFSSVNDRQVEV